MHNLTKTFLTSLALTLGACDVDKLDSFGDEASEFRPGGFGTFSLNTSYIGEAEDFGEMDLTGAVHKYSQLTQLCLPSAPRSPCFNPQKDKIWLDDIGQIHAANDQGHFYGASFKGSLWSMNLDYDRDGAKDSTITLQITNALPKTEPNTGTDYWEYHWAYKTSTATGLVTKFLKPSEQPTPMCLPDPDKAGSTYDSIASIQLSATVDTSEKTDGIVSYGKNIMLSACYGGALAKAYVGWGYPRPQDISYEAYTSVLRVIRADYCNNGTSFTAPGQKLAVTDGMGYNDQFDASLMLEGRASFKEGWQCINRPRMVDISEVTSACEIRFCDEEKVDVAAMGADDIVTQVF